MAKSARFEFDCKNGVSQMSSLSEPVDFALFGAVEFARGVW